MSVSYGSIFWICVILFVFLLRGKCNEPHLLSPDEKKDCDRKMKSFESFIKLLLNLIPVIIIVLLASMFFGGKEDDGYIY